MVSRGRRSPYIELIMLSHQCIMQQMPVHLATSAHTNIPAFPQTHLRFYQHQINKQYHEVMLYVFIAESSAILAHCETHSMARGAVIGARVFGVEGLDGVATFYADWHCKDLGVIWTL